MPALPAEAILAALPETAWEDIAWRQGSKGALVKRFARVRVHRTGQRGKHLRVHCSALSTAAFKAS
jgi:hypothetical protein